MLTARQKLHNIKTKVRLISDRIWRQEGWGVCTTDLEQALLLHELDRLAGVEPEPLPDEISRALQNYDANADLAGSIKQGLAAIRERVAAGGPAWNPKEPGGDRG